MTHEHLVVKRIRRLQRDDDREETVQNRLVVYEEKTAPLIAYYRERGKLLTVNGDAEIDTVTDSIVKGLS